MNTHISVDPISAQHSIEVSHWTKKVVIWIFIPTLASREMIIFDVRVYPMQPLIVVSFRISSFNLFFNFLRIKARKP